MQKIKQFNSATLKDLVFSANINTRRRKHLNLHQSYSEKCQKVINAVDMTSYIAPHRHSLDPKTETLIALNGAFALFTFDDRGCVTEVVKLEMPRINSNSIACFGLDIFPDTWHTVIALAPSSILLEIKEGPFFPDSAKEVAPWAPDEGSKDAFNYLRLLRGKIKRSPAI